MRIEFMPQAKKDWKDIDNVHQVKILSKLDVYSKSPDALRNQVIRLVGSRSLRLRVGDYRVIFEEDGTILRVQHVAHRRDVYR